MKRGLDLIGEYGVVCVTVGQNAGRLGYYDDEASERSALVYLDGHGYPGLGRYTVIPFKRLREATPDEVRTYRARNMDEAGATHGA